MHRQWNLRMLAGLVAPTQAQISTISSTRLLSSFMAVGREVSSTSLTRGPTAVTYSCSQALRPRQAYLGAECTATALHRHTALYRQNVHSSLLCTSRAIPWPELVWQSAVWQSRILHGLVTVPWVAAQEEEGWNT